ncbi:LysM peptidoglycan-binding domain-containing protein [Halobacteriovorax sp. HLS]|uniref:LysM peptidoglycan-binding domain-containing protein n=1 Tax=Halobacteriovorax sp. HLS TaxID=2234000 RepID=UPI000FDC2D67|nr:LysM peptidoglycan-binding domain-containing protein [Halobacteriovorax sp. HLS]
MKKTSNLLFLLALSSCSHISPIFKKKTEAPRSIKQLTSEKTYKKVEKKHFVKKEVIEVEPEKEDLISLIEPKREEVQKPLVSNYSSNDEHNLELKYEKKHYDFWLKYFSKREPARFKRHMANGLKFEKIVRDVFEEHGLPADLFFVGLIESGFNTHIRSHASAVGPWQFIKGTGDRYGLKIDRYLDERRNIYKSSHAAANYFKDLYNIFGSWELALCAYNAGEYRIINAIRKGNTRDYRELVRKKLIPKETIYYVPKVAAARHLFKNRNKYGLHVKRKGEAFYLNVDEVVAKKSLSIDDLSRKMNISLATLRKLNPEVKKSWIAVTRRRPVTLLLPKGQAEKFASLNFSKRSRTVASRKKSVSQSVSTTSSSVYKVRRGDNLYKISRRFNLPIKNIKTANGLRSSKIRIGQRLKIPVNGTKYTVRNGDNLTHIAKKFGVSIKTLVAANNLDGHIIYRGQKLFIPSES